MMIGSIWTLNKTRESVVVSRTASEILVFFWIEPLCVCMNPFLRRIGLSIRLSKACALLSKVYGVVLGRVPV